MNRTDDWRLTVHYWPRATDAGVRPQLCTGFSFDDSPAPYRAHEVNFSNPPTREDFLAVVAQTPWMHVWEQTLLPVIEKNQWPMIDPAHKGSSVELKDGGGRIVGKLEVWRQQRHCNSRYSVPMIGTYPGSAIDRFLKRRIRDKEKRAQARHHVEAHRNLILERVAQSTDYSPTQLLGDVAQVLIEGGFLPRVKRRAIAA